MKKKKIQNLPLDKFINFSLYNKKLGYYMKKNPFGEKGDFITAPNISRLFSEMIAIWILSFWKSLDSPKKFNLIELGAGNGEMMKILIESFQNFPEFFKSCKIIIHEKIPDFFARPYEKKSWDIYKKIFVTPNRIDGGKRFYNEYGNIIQKTISANGVPVDPFIVVSIIGIESNYGLNKGKYTVFR